MKKNEFIKLIAQRTNIAQKDVAIVVDAYEDTILEDVIAKCDSYRTAFGTIKGYMHDPVPAREGRNPATGEKIIIPAKDSFNAPKITWSKAAKE